MRKWITVAVPPALLDELRAEATRQKTTLSAVIRTRASAAPARALEAEVRTLRHALAAKDDALRRSYAFGLGATVKRDHDQT